MHKAMATMLFVLVTGPAAAITPASPEEILCRQESAIVGTVVAARSHDCGAIRGRCYSHFVGLTLRVDEVLAPSRGDLHAGDLVRAGFRVMDAPPLRVGTTDIPMNRGGGGTLGFAVTRGRISDAAARAAFVGQRFVVALLAVKHVLRERGGPDTGFAAAVGEPYYGLAYPSSDEAWVRTTWPTRCPAWRH